MITLERGRNVLLAMAASFVLLGSLPSRASAQWRSAVAVGAPAIGASYQIDRKAIAVPNDSWRTRDFWTWTGLGVLAGAVVADGWVALEIARNHSDDAMIPPIVPLAIFGAAGGVGGGLIGAIAYTASHPKPEPSP